MQKTDIKEKNFLQQKFQSYDAPQRAQALGIYPYFRTIDSEQDTVVFMKGKKVLMFGSNSYLGLSNDPRIKEAAKQAIDKYGVSCSGSRFLNGTLDLHLELEEKLARLVGKDEAICFTTGFQANLGALSSLCGRNDVILLDSQDHASIIEGSRLSFARVLKFAHNDMHSLEEKLNLCTHNNIKFIVVDGVFSMEGDICNLPAIIDLAQKYGASIMVDDAHGIGVLGPQGRGTPWHFNAVDKVEIIMGTFSKSLASIGGFIAGSKEVMNYLRHNARSLIFSASLPPASVASASKAIDIMLAEPERIERLWKLTSYARKAFQDAGIDTGKSQTPIIPLYVRDDLKVLKAAMMLMDEGLFVNPVVSPAVPKEDSLIRFSLMATHTFEQIDYAVEKIVKVFKTLQILNNNS